MEYSRELIKKMQNYWLKKYSEEITEDIATQYLNSFARLISVLDNDEK